MERKINYLSICYTLFLILLFLSGSLTGILSEAVYILAFLIPLALGIFLTGEKEAELKHFLINKENTKFFLPLVFPTVTAVMLLSLVTSLIMNALTGAENSVDVGTSLVPALISHALLPAILEEILFRYLPMRMLGGHSGRVTVLLSAAFFALIHHNLFSLCYAFFAGVVFMAVDLACESVIPSVIIHFVNNAISVGLLVYQDNTAFAPSVFIILGVLSAVSAIFIVIGRQIYKERFNKVFSGGGKFKLTLPAVALATLCLAIAVISIL